MILAHGMTETVGVLLGARHSSDGRVREYLTRDLQVPVAMLVGFRRVCSLVKEERLSDASGAGERGAFLSL